jgi:hypothetical protein
VTALIHLIKIVSNTQPTAAHATLRMSKRTRMPNWYLGSSALVRFMTWSRFHRANKPQSLNPFDLLRFIHPCLKSFDSPTATYGVLYTSVFTVLRGPGYEFNPSDATVVSGARDKVTWIDRKTGNRISSGACTRVLLRWALVTGARSSLRTPSTRLILLWLKQVCTLETT